MQPSLQNPAIANACIEVEPPSQEQHEKEREKEYTKKTHTQIKMFELVQSIQHIE